MTDVTHLWGPAGGDLGSLGAIMSSFFSASPPEQRLAFELQVSCAEEHMFSYFHVSSISHGMESRSWHMQHPLG
jgi:hypothetical protein